MKIARFDVGANNGSDSIEVAKKNPNLLVYGFEPTPELNSFIESRLRLENIPNYNLVKCAVSDFEGTSIFNVAGQSDWGCSSLLEFSEESKTEWVGRTDFVVTQKIEVQVIRLDRFVEENHIDLIEYLHIDTQGSDLNVLKGLGEKLSIVRAGVMEAAAKENVLYNGQNTEEECIRFIYENGFLVERIESNDVHRNEVNIFFRNKKNI
jgi:FkbM family methyltransferase